MVELEAGVRELRLRVVAQRRRAGDGRRRSLAAGPALRRSSEQGAAS